MSTRELFYFTARCLTLDERPDFRDDIIHAFTSEELLADDFIYFCDIHLVLPAIYLIFNKHNLLHVFPAEYLDHLAAIYLRNKKRNQEILQQVDEINKALQKENIVAVYLKGTANLLDNVYSDLGQRMIGDIDLLVAENDFLKSADLIMKLGYQSEGRIYHDMTFAKHFPRLYRTDVPADIEIHRIPVDKVYSRQFTSGIIFQNKKQVPDKINCFVPSDAHKAIHSFIHAQLSNLGYWFIQTSLRDVYDMHLLLGVSDTNSVINQAEEKRKINKYVIFTTQVFGNGNNKEIHEKRAFRGYIKWHNWFLDHPKIHRWHIFVVKIGELLSRFFRGMKKVVSVKSWGIFFKNITDPEWYKMLIYRIKNFYKNYIS